MLRVYMMCLDTCTPTSARLLAILLLSKYSNIPKQNKNIFDLIKTLEKKLLRLKLRNPLKFHK
jgi:hypothetical protein